MDVGSKHNVPGDCVFWVKNRPCAGRSHGSRGTQSPDHGAPMCYSSVFSTSRCSVSQMFRSRSSFKRILTNVSVGSSVHAGGPGGGKKSRVIWSRSDSSASESQLPLTWCYFWKTKHPESSVRAAEATSCPRAEPLSPAPSYPLSVVTASHPRCSHPQHSCLLTQSGPAASLIRK